MRQLSVHQDDPLRELFESCKTGDLIKVRKLINPQTVNARDTAGRKSTPLHFAAGKCEFILLKYNPSFAAAALYVLRHVIYGPMLQYFSQPNEQCVIQMISTKLYDLSTRLLGFDYYYYCVSLQSRCGYHLQLMQL